MSVLSVKFVEVLKAMNNDILLLLYVHLWYCCITWSWHYTLVDKPQLISNANSIRVTVESSVEPLPTRFHIHRRSYSLHLHIIGFGEPVFVSLLPFIFSISDFTIPYTALLFPSAVFNHQETSGPIWRPSWPSRDDKVHHYPRVIWKSLRVARRHHEELLRSDQRKIISEAESELARRLAELETEPSPSTDPASSLWKIFQIIFEDKLNPTGHGSKTTFTLNDIERFDVEEHIVRRFIETREVVKDLSQKYMALKRSQALDKITKEIEDFKQDIEKEGVQPLL